MKIGFKDYNIPFIKSTLVISPWENERLIGAVRVLSDKMFRSIIYVLPEFQNKGAGSMVQNSPPRHQYHQLEPDCSNIISQHVAVQAGYLPAWSHCFRTRLGALLKS